MPFPNKELSFDLPENEYSGLMEKSFPRIILSRAEEPKSETKAEKADKHEKTDTGTSFNRISLLFISYKFVKRNFRSNKKKKFFIDPKIAFFGNIMTLPKWEIFTMRV